jgi:hypothetical protein
VSLSSFAERELFHFDSKESRPLKLEKSRIESNGYYP